MKILIYTKATELGEWSKETLNEFGRGMHIRVSDKPELAGGNWSFIILLGEERPDVADEKKCLHYPVPQGDDERSEYRRKLWTLYRDTLRDMIGSKCSCGLYDVCHCH